MAFKKLLSFTKKVQDLSDQPTLTPSELKAFFDAAPDEVRTYFNQLIDDMPKEVLPYSGATKDVDLNGKALLNLILLSLKDAAGDGYYFSLGEDGTSGNAVLKSRTSVDGLPFADLMSVSKDGIIGFPLQSYASVNSGSTLSIPSGADTKITTLTSEVSDRQNEFANSRFTAKTAGVYLVSLFADFGASIPTGDTFAKLYKNGAAAFTVGASYATRIAAGTSVIELTAGDYLEFYISQNSSGTAKTLGGARMQVVKIA